MTVVVVHPVPLVGEALSGVLVDAVGEDVRTCSSTAALIEAAGDVDVALALVDESLLDGDVPALCMALAAENTSVLALVGTRERLLDLLAAGVRGIVDAQDTIDGVVAAIDAVGAGMTHLPPHLLSSVLLDVIVERRVAAHRETNDDKHAGATTGLSHREREVLLLLSRGGDQSDIARELAIAPSTAKTHIARIMAKLNARTRTEAVDIAVRSGLVPSTQEMTA